MHHPHRTLRWIPLPGILLSVTLSGQEAPPRVAAAELHATPVLHAARATAPIRLDGRLDEAAWSAAGVAEGFVQRSPDPGAPASEQTEVRVLYDDGALYVAARMYDSRPDSIAAPLARRDPPPSLYSDWVEVLVDSYHDRRTAFRFAVNPRGVRRDVYQSNDAGEDAGWDAVWDAATSVDAEGWTAELRIPLSQLRYGREAGEERVWGVNFSRTLARRDETSFWSHVPPNHAGLVSRAGELRGLVGLATPRRLEVLPYTSARVTQEPADGVDPADPFHRARELTGSAGADLRAGLPLGLTLSATLNPDFGQVEVDPAVVNLSAYETLLPENRPFFVEGSDIFRFGSLLSFISPGYAPFFYTRRIGRAPQRSLGALREARFFDAPGQSTIMGAAKVSGRTPGGWSVGIMDAVTGREDGAYVDAAGERASTPVEPLTNYFVGRVRRDLRAGSTVVGGIVTATHRDMGDGVFDDLLRSHAYVGGVDFEHSWGDRRYAVSGYLAGSSIHGSPEAIAAAQRSSARYFRRPDAEHLEYRPDRTSLAGYNAALALRTTGDWRGSVYYQEVSPGFETNDAGYLTRADTRLLNALYGYRRSRPGPLLRDWFVRAFTAQQWNFGGDKISESYSVRGNATFHSLWSASFTATYGPRTLSDRLTRGGPLTASPRSRGVDAGVGSDPRKKLSASLFAMYQEDEIGGRFRYLSLGVSARPGHTVRISVNPSLSVDHDLGQWVTAVPDARATATHGRRDVFATLDQTTLAVGTRLDWTFTPTLSLQLYAQPFVSAAGFRDYKELAAPRTAEFVVYGRDRGTLANLGDGVFRVDPDGDGPAESFTLGRRFGQSDFNYRSLRGNAVLRWEYRPGSTLFLVWQQERSGVERFGDFEGGRDLGGILDAPGRNVFLVKATYWLSR